mgnify:CR=1 FL=1
MSNNNNFLKILSNCIRLDLLIMITVSYSIGAGLVSYLGRGIYLQQFLIGFLITNLFYVSAELISCYFFYTDKFAKERNPELLRFRSNLFVLFILVFTLISLFIYFVYQNFHPSSIFLILLTSFLGFLLFYAIPPMNLKKRGFGEILLSIFVVSITPMFAFNLQMKEMHTTLFMITFPSFFLLISFFLAQKLENYAEDIKLNQNSLMTKLGWKTGMNLHNIFVLITYALYGIAAIFGLPFRLFLPALLSFPIGCIQLWEMWRIGEGYKPRWKLLKISSIGSLSILAYFLLFNLWLR